MAELVDALDLGSSAERRGGSSPFIRTIFQTIARHDATPGRSSQSMAVAQSYVSLETGEMVRKQFSILYAGLIVAGIVAGPSSASPFDDLNRPVDPFDRPGITGCGRDRPCDWNADDRDPSEYREPRIDYDLGVPIEPGREPYVGRRSRLFPPEQPVRSHQIWCMERYRTYSPRDDSFQPYEGVRRRCVSPYR